MQQYDYITLSTRDPHTRAHIHCPRRVSLKIGLEYMFIFFKKLCDPLTPRLLSESRFRGRTECGEGEDRRHDGREGEGEGERPFIRSDKETSRIGVYHTFNWTSSLCLAGRLKWTTGMCQLAPRPSTSPVHSCYQPPTISISPSLDPSHPPSLSCSHPTGLVLPPLLFLSPCSLMCIPGILLSYLRPLLSISTSYFASPPCIYLSISPSSALPTFPCVFSVSP